MTKMWEMREQATIIEVPTCLVCNQPIRQVSVNSFLKASCKCGCGEVWAGDASRSSGSVRWDTLIYMGR